MFSGRPDAISGSRPRGEIGERLVDDEERFRMTCGQLPQPRGRDHLSGRVVRPAEEEDLVPPEAAAIALRSGAKPASSRRGSRLHGAARELRRAGVVDIGRDGDQRARLFRRTCGRRKRSSVEPFPIRISSAETP